MIVFLWPVKGELVELRNVARLNISKRIVINNKIKLTLSIDFPMDSVFVLRMFDNSLSCIFGKVRSLYRHN